MLVVLTSVMEMSNDTRHHVNENQRKYVDEAEIIWNPHKELPSDL